MGFRDAEIMVRTVLITGASQGLGEILAQRFWASGFNLKLVARNRDRLKSVHSKLNTQPEQSCHLFPCDLSDQANVNQLIAELIDTGRPIDVLVNNAATHGPIGPLWENNLDDWERAIRVDLLSPVALCHGLIPLMKASGGSIINLSGGGATGPRCNFTAYGTAKAALVRFSETLAGEVRGFGIRVNCIAPGAMRTALLGEVLDSGAMSSGEQEYQAASKVFTDGGTSLDKVADLALFLASDTSKGITGKIISAVWDNWEMWPSHANELNRSDAYTLRRITGRDRGMEWGDK